MGRQTIRYEVVDPYYCDSCERLIGQLSTTRAWLMTPADPCTECDTNLAALFLRALWDDLQVTHVPRNHD